MFSSPNNPADPCKNISPFIPSFQISKNSLLPHGRASQFANTGTQFHIASLDQSSQM